MYWQMKRLSVLASTLATVLFISIAIAVAEGEEDSNNQATSSIESALKKVEQFEDPADQIQFLEIVGKETLAASEGNLLVKEIVQKVQGSDAAPRERVKQWQAALGESRDILRFKPLIEAPMPKGFPPPTPVGQLRLQQYPAYRLARTEMERAGRGAFWSLFMHIKKRDIAMTAPVEMTYSANAKQRPKKVSMAFLYRNTDQGKLGDSGGIEVADIPAQKAISFGIRGDATEQRVADAKGYLEQWLKDHEDQYEPAGSLRVMGYNSPFVPDRKRFTEVQIPVREKVTKHTDAPLAREQKNGDSSK